MDAHFFLIARSGWIRSSDKHGKRLAYGLVPLGSSISHLTKDCEIQLKFDDGSGIIIQDTKIERIKNEFYIRSKDAANLLVEIDAAKYAMMFFEGTSSEARCVLQVVDAAFFSKIEEEEPTLRLLAYDLPPLKSVVVEADKVKTTLYQRLSSKYEELFATYTTRFLNAPHILTPLISHVLAVSSEDGVNLPIKLKKLSENLRAVLLREDSPIKIGRFKKSHLETWADAQGKRVAFLDGGVARIPAMLNLEPLAQRIGIYSVEVGCTDMDERERWRLWPFVISDMIVHDPNMSTKTDQRRLGEAARYMLEPLMGLRHLEDYPDTDLLMLHGPLVNQHVQYDDEEPNCIPPLNGEFLKSVGVTEDDVISTYGNPSSIPRSLVKEKLLWSHFMAVYGYVTNQLFNSDKEVCGVVERSMSSTLIAALIEAIHGHRLISKEAANRIIAEIKKYKLSDYFVFGCMLREGEYITPVQVSKNPPNRARDRWRPVVRKFPQPYTTIIKPEESKFPFRIEMNEAANANHVPILNLVYHISRLLPRYAFPVGLDIVDKYAKIPDWLSRGVSDELAASIMKKVLKTGDPNLVSQFRNLLAGNPRDFFFRPKT